MRIQVLSAGLRLSERLCVRLVQCCMVEAKAANFVACMGVSNGKSD